MTGRTPVRPVTAGLYDAGSPGGHQTIEDTPLPMRGPTTRR